jgi:hypothetical protein
METGVTGVLENQVQDTWSAMPAALDWNFKCPNHARPGKFFGLS